MIILRKLNRYINGLLGVNIFIIWHTLCEIPYFIYTTLTYLFKKKPANFSLKITKLYPILTERSSSAGNIKSPYYFQDIWAARKIYKANPTRHIDIGSRIDGFISHLLVFRSVEVIDIRPLSSHIEGLSFTQSDATTLSSFNDNCIESLSSLHAAEHFGLGRYNDSIDPFAHEHFIHHIQRVLKPGGLCYFSVPIGKERLEFNAHRIFSPKTILSLFSDCSCLSFSYTDDSGKIFSDVAIPDTFTQHFFCGLFEFQKHKKI
ncbi:hypothetical protein DID78_05235 [Candidatus Marinamargulisbacteria bacterium SCGC AG-343-D04]|nr:hypothetical protein DID78_05235 [Candidatus Marinamargulisbacteria bacterium SCGC AG-343-D04]